MKKSEGLEIVRSLQAQGVPRAAIIKDLERNVSTATANRWFNDANHIQEDGTAIHDLVIETLTDQLTTAKQAGDDPERITKLAFTLARVDCLYRSKP